MATGKLYGEESFQIGFSPHKTFPEDPTSAAGNTWRLVATNLFRPMKTDEELRAPRIRGHLQPDYRDVINTFKGVPQTFAIESFDPTAEDLLFILAPFFQNYSEAAGGPPHVDTFTPPSDQIDFDGDAGYLIHACAKHPTADKSFIAGDAIATEFTISISPDGEKQRLMVSANYLSRQHYLHDDPHTWGTPDYTAQYFIGYYDLEDTNSYVKIDTVAMPFHSAELHMTNNGQRAGGADSDGLPVEYKIGPFDGDGTLTLYRNTAADAVIDDWASREQMLLEILWQDTGTFGSTGDMEIKHYIQVKTPVPEFGPAGEEVWSIPFSMIKGASNEMASYKISTNLGADALFT
jgi:hypothetical protein